MRVLKSTEVSAGVTTFAAMSYIAFVNPVILQPLGMAPGAVFLFTCLTAAAASAVAARAVDLPTALACSMGLNTFTASYSIIHQVPWPNLLFVCFIVSVIVLFCSLTSFRLNLLESVPLQIFAAITAGIGAMLADVAIKETVSFAKQAGALLALVLFALGLTIILVIKWLGAYTMTVRSASPRKVRISAMLDSWCFVASIFVLFPLTWWAHRPTIFNPGAPVLWVWAQANPPWWQITAENLNKSWGYAIAVFFIMLMDIAGSPLDFLKQEFDGRPIDRVQAQMFVRRSFWVDSSANILAPLAGVTPLVYYAENHAGWRAGGRHGRSAAVVSLGFLVLALIGGLCIWLRFPFVEFIPRFVVMPTLFFVGLTIIAESFTAPASSVGVQQQLALPDVTAVRPDERTDVGRTFYLLPAAVTTVFATTTTLDATIAAGILSYMMVALFPREYLGVHEEKRERLAIIYLGAFAVLLLSLWNAFA